MARKITFHILLRVVAIGYITFLCSLARGQSLYLTCPPTVSCVPDITLAGGVTGTGTANQVAIFNAPTSITSQSLSISGDGNTTITQGASVLSYTLSSNSGLGTINFIPKYSTTSRFTNSQLFDNASTVMIQSTTAYGSLGQNFEINRSGAGGATYSGAAFNSWNSNATRAAFLSFNKSASATIGTQSAVASGELLGAINWGGSNGTTFLNYANISAEADAATGAADAPGRLLFYTTPDASTTLTERMRIDNAGNVGIGATAGANQIIRASRSTNGEVSVNVQNTSTGTAGYAAMVVQNSATNFSMFNFSSGYTTAGAFVASRGVLSNTGNGGIALVSNNATGNINFYTGGSADANLRLSISNTGIVTTSSVTISGQLSIATGLVTTGTYTPTLTNATNISASTAYGCNYMQVGNVVTVSGVVDVDPTAAASTVLRLSLPIASDFSAAGDCGGTSASPAVAGLCAAMTPNFANDTADMVWVAVDTSNRTFYFSFTYLIR